MWEQKFCDLDNNPPILSPGTFQPHLKDAAIVYRHQEAWSTVAELQQPKRCCEGEREIAGFRHVGVFIESRATFTGDALNCLPSFLPRVWIPQRARRFER